MSTNTNTQNYFGDCPVCHRNDGYINIGKGHWFYCAEHKKTWYVGSNLFSGWRDQTQAEQHSIYDALGFGQFERVAA